MTWPRGRQDEELVRLAQRGDETAFRELCDRHVALLRPVVERRLTPALRRVVSASDVIQEAYLVVAQRIDGFENRGEGSFEAWLRRIVELKVKEVLDRYVRTAKRDVRSRVSRHGRPDTASFPARGPSPSQAAIGSELRDRVRAAIAGLPPDYAAVIRLIQEEHKTIAETAAAMDRSENAVKKLYGRALSRLAEALGLAEDPKKG